MLDSWNLSLSGVDWSTCCVLNTLNPHGTVSLTAGDQYWVVAAPDPNQFTFAGFFLNDIGATGPFAQSVNGGPFVITQGEALAAFDVIGNSVPEGNTLVPGALGLAGCLMVFLKRRFAGNSTQFSLKTR